MRAKEFSAGLIEHLPISLPLPDHREQKFARSLRERRPTHELGAVPLDVRQHRQARTVLAAVELRKQEAAQRLWQASHGGDTGQAAASYQQLRSLQEQGQDLLRHLGGAELKQYAGQAHRLNDQLAGGQRSFSDLTPAQANQVVTFHSGHPVADLLDSQAGPSKVGRGLRQFRNGLAALPRDGGQQLLEAVNTLWGHELDGLVGQHAWDGSTVTAAEFAAPVPHPGSPRHMLLTARLSTRAPDGRAGSAIVPVTEDHGHLLAHPEQSAGAAVKTLGLAELMHRYGELDTVHRAINADPRLRHKLLDSFLQGDDDHNARLLDWMRVLGANPRHWEPRQSLGRLVADAHVDLESAPPHTATAQPLAPAPRSGAPSLEQFLERARQANPDVGDAELEAYWHRKYGAAAHAHKDYSHLWRSQADG